MIIEENGTQPEETTDVDGTTSDSTDEEPTDEELDEEEVAEDEEATLPEDGEDSEDEQIDYKKAISANEKWPFSQ